MLLLYINRRSVLTLIISFAKFLYDPFPVESCLEGRMCEIINAEVSIGTITCLSDAVGYLKWTFYSRRVKMNPSYYGAKSSSEEDIEEFYIEAITETMNRLKNEGCILVDETEGTDSLVAPTSLGRACSNFYLLYQTPLQMQKGANSMRKILCQHASDEQMGQEMPLQSFLNQEMTKRVKFIYTMNSDTPIRKFAVAKILYELSQTHGKIFCTMISNILDIF